MALNLQMDNPKTRFNLWLVTAWFGASFTSLIFAVLFNIYLSTATVVIPQNQNFKLFASIPQNGIQISESVIHADARPKLIADFFKQYGSPLANVSQFFVETADRYDLDYRLLPSIAMQESKGGQKIVDSSYNPFGYGIYGGIVLRFASWQEAIDKVGQGLRKYYLDQGLTTPSQIMAKYTPPSLAKGGPWAKGVDYFMEQLR